MHFDPPLKGREQDETSAFRPKFGADGLITAVTSDARTGEVLMVAHMNADALARTIETGKAHYWSRSRQEIWLKGETSGNVQTVVEMLTDCDQDAVLLKVEIAGAHATCHTGRTGCFYRRVVSEENGARLEFDGRPPLFSPDDVYKK